MRNVVITPPPMTLSVIDIVEGLEVWAIKFFAKGHAPRAVIAQIVRVIASF